MNRTIVSQTVIIIFFCGIAIFGQNIYYDQAKLHFERGTALMEMAKSPADYEAAIKQFQQAARLWPDFPEVFFNLACAQEKTGEYGAVEENLSHYLMRVPDARGTEKVKNLISRLKKKYGYGGFNPLLDAAKKNQVEIAGRLIAQGADVNARDRSGWTPLDEAVLWGQKEVAELLIAQGADVNDKRGNGKAPLHHVVLGALTDKVGGKRLMELVKLLIAKGADINAKDEYGWTPLHDAVNTLHDEFSLEMVELLIAKGANIKARDNRGSTPLHFAASQGLRDAVALFIAQGADVNVRDEYGCTPLHRAANRAQKEMIELLVTQGADVNARDENGKTPMHYAEIIGYTDTAARLWKYASLLTKLENFAGLARMQTLALFFLNFVILLIALVNILRSKFKGNYKPLWLFAVILLPFLGPLCYFVIGRKQKTGGKNQGNLPLR